MNDSTAKRQLRTAWELPALIRPLSAPIGRARRPRGQLMRHDPAVVEFVYEHRYATGFQVQRRFHKYLRSDRTRHRHLERLISHGYLRTAPVRSTAPHFPAVYSATRKGIRLIRDSYAALGREWEGWATEEGRAYGTTANAILHELLTTEFDLTVRRIVDSRPDLSWVLGERRYFRRERQLRYTEQGRVHRVVPDSGFVVRRDQPDDLRHLPHFVELDNGTMPVPRIREKYERYQHWATSPEGRDYLLSLAPDGEQSVHRPAFRLLMVAHSNERIGDDERRLLDLILSAGELPAWMRKRVWLVTAADLAASAGDAEVWLRLRDVPRSSHQRLVTARSWLAPRLGAVPRRQLFRQLRDRPRPSCPT